MTRNPLYLETILYPPSFVYTQHTQVPSSCQNKQELKLGTLWVLYRNMYGDKAVEPEDILVPDWDKNPLFFGAYSNWPIGNTPQTRQGSHTGNENPIYVFLFWELRGLSPNFHIHASVSNLCIPRIGPHISCSRIGRSMVGIYKSLTWTWKLELLPRNSQKEIFVSNFGFWFFEVQQALKQAI
jgi:hypothetical protein